MSERELVDTTRHAHDVSQACSAAVERVGGTSTVLGDAVNNVGGIARYIELLGRTVGLMLGVPVSAKAPYLPVLSDPNNPPGHVAVAQAKTVIGTVPAENLYLDSLSSSVGSGSFPSLGFI